MAYEWFYQQKDAEVGPITSKDLLNLAQRGQLVPTDLVRRADMEKWTPAGNVKGLEFNRSQPSLPHGSSGGFATTAGVDGQHLEFAITESGRRVELLNDGRWKDSPLAKIEDGKTALPAVAKATLGSQAGPHFRKASWGMSELEVRDTEAGTPSWESRDSIHYDTSIAELECKAIYIFCQKQLVRGKYYIEEAHSNDNAYLFDYERLKDLLVEKYGRPISVTGQQSDMVWYDDLYEDDPDDWGTAVALGHLAYQCKWDLPETEVFLLLCGDNGEVRLSIGYISKQLGHLEREAKQRRDLDNL